MSTDKKTKLMDAAIKLFAQKGFDNTSTGSVSSEAGVATGTLFKYFSSKEELIVEAYLHTKKLMIARIKEDLDPNLDFKGLMQHLWDTSIDWSLEHIEHHKFMMQVKSSRLAGDAVKEKIDQEFLFLYVAINAAQQAGEIEEIPLELIQLSFAAFYNMTVDYITVFGADATESKQRIFEMLYRSIQHS